MPVLADNMDFVQAKLYKRSKKIIKRNTGILNVEDFLIRASIFHNEICYNKGKIDIQTGIKRKRYYQLNYG